MVFAGSPHSRFFLFQVCVMFDTGQWQPAQARSRRKAQSRASRSKQPAFFLHQLNKGESLFSAGDCKAHLYRVESGVISISWRSPDGTVTAIETVEANQFFGLGYLDAHPYTAVALSDSMVSCWPLEALAFVIEQFPGTRDRQNDAVEREFAHRRASLIAAAPTGGPAARLAGFLCVVARMAENEGRDPHVVSETMRCPVVAQYLKVDIDTLSDALLELHRAGLVAPEAGGRLRLLDLARLESIASPMAVQTGARHHGP